MNEEKILKKFKEEVRQQFKEVDLRFKEVNQRFTEVDLRFDKLEQKIDDVLIGQDKILTIVSRLDEERIVHAHAIRDIDDRVDAHDADINKIKTKF